LLGAIGQEGFEMLAADHAFWLLSEAIINFFIGVWIAQRATTLQIPHWQVLPLLALTFMFSPLGYAAFIGLRAVHHSRSQNL
jgi:hypothetical protein